MSVDRDIVVAALPAYEVGPQIGAGGFGMVLEARHRRLGRAAAVKVLPLGRDPALAARFLAEAQVLATLEHPHVVPIFDYVEQGGLCLLVMELLRGGTLAEWTAARGRPSPEEAVAAGIAMAEALACAHGHGVLHRDVKPDNAMFSERGLLKVTDFGIARMVDATAGLTATGTVLGTPQYMAPELITAEPASPASDVYGLGLVLHELLAGRHPYPPLESVAAVLHQRLTVDPPALADVAPHVPAAVSEVVARMVARTPGDRPSGAHEAALLLARAGRDGFGGGWLGSSGIAVKPDPDVVAAASAATDGVAVGPPPPPHAVTTGAPPARRGPRSRRRRPMIAGGAALVVALAVLAVLLGPRGGTGTATIPALDVELDEIGGLAFDSGRGALLVADTSHHRVLAVKGATATVLAGDGTARFRGDGGDARTASLASPHGIAVTSTGAVLVADTGNTRIRRIDPDGTITTIVGPAGLAAPAGVAVLADGGLLVVDATADAVFRVGSDGALQDVPLGLEEPRGIAVAPAGPVVVADAGNNRILIGDAPFGNMLRPTSVAVGADGAVFVADPDSHKVFVFRSGGQSTLAGTGSAGNSGDLGPATEARLDRPTAVAASADGIVFVGDSGAHRVRKVLADGVIEPVAGR